MYERRGMRSCGMGDEDERKEKVDRGMRLMNCSILRRKELKRQQVLKAIETGRHSWHNNHSMLFKMACEGFKNKFALFFPQTAWAYFGFLGTRRIESNYLIDAQADHHKN